MLASPVLIFSSERSLMRTSTPASAQTCAMPVPIWPAPMMPTVLISEVIVRAPTILAPRHGSSAGFRQLFFEFRKESEEVAYQAVVGNLEDRRLLVLVDGD